MYMNKWWIQNDCKPQFIERKHVFNIYDSKVNEDIVLPFDLFEDVILILIILYRYTDKI